VSVFVDTSALLALLDEDEVHHRDAAAIFAALPPTTDLVTTSYVVVETIALVRRRLSAAEDRKLTDDLLPAIRVVWVDEAAHGTGMATYRAAARSASIVDHVSFAVMRSASINDAFAFDGDFEQQGFFRLSPPADPAPRRLSEERASYVRSSAGGDELVSVAEVAARAGRSRNTIQSWRRRHSDFPQPVAQLATGPVWLWPAVGQWIQARSRARNGGSYLPVPARAD
jgi:predicted nucleic acid-binding protein/predicted DNA-binding transcriptional regulator AlpA